MSHDEKELSMNAKVVSAETPDELDVEIQKFISNGFTPTLACVFCSVAQPLEKILSIFAERHIAIFGCTSSGEIAGLDAFEESIVVMLFNLPTDAFRIKLFDGMYKTSYQVGQEVATWAQKIFNAPALLVLSAGLQADGEAFVHGVIVTMGYEAPLFGGLAGDDLKMQGTYTFTEKEITGLGVLALALDNVKIEVNGLAVSGWKGIGTIKTVTRAEGNVVYTIDDHPALDVYSRYFNINLGDDQTLAAEYPLQVMREDGSFVLRAAMIINPDKSMVYAGTVPQGSQVQFSMPPSTEIIDFAIQNLSHFKQDTTNADALILFSCKGRHLALGPMIEDEIDSIFHLWEAPMVGFFTYGEIGPTKAGRCDFHNNTLTLVTLREK